MYLIRIFKKYQYYRNATQIYTEKRHCKIWTFLCFKDFLASEDKDIEDGLTDRVERAVMVDVSVNHILTGAVQVQMYPLTHQVQARRHSAGKTLIT